MLQYQSEINVYIHRIKQTGFIKAFFLITTSTLFNKYIWKT